MGKISLDLIGYLQCCYSLRTQNFSMGISEHLFVHVDTSILVFCNYYSWQLLGVLHLPLSLVSCLLHFHSSHSTMVLGTSYSTCLI